MGPQGDIGPVGATGSMPRMRNSVVAQTGFYNVNTANVAATGNSEVITMVAPGSSPAYIGAYGNGFAAYPNYTSSGSFNYGALALGLGQSANGYCGVYVNTNTFAQPQGGFFNAPFLGVNSGSQSFSASLMYIYQTSVFAPVYRVGFFSERGNAAPSGAYFELDTASSANWSCVYASESVPVRENSPLPIANSGSYSSVINFRIDSDSNGLSYFINDQCVLTVPADRAPATGVYMPGVEAFCPTESTSKVVGAFVGYHDLYCILSNPR
jgi:hypothetical protein